jgi:hypothetical protein
MLLNVYVIQVDSEYYMRQRLEEADRDRLAQQARQHRMLRTVGPSTHTALGWVLIAAGLIGIAVEYFR